jgi:hypothetical protein
MIRVTETDKRFSFTYQFVTGDSYATSNIPGKTLEDIVNSVKNRKDILINDIWINTNFIVSYQIALTDNPDAIIEFRGTEELSIYFREVTE